MAKKKGHGHHGGAWKVAYADFVTAMMALFLVLWLTSQDQKVRDAVQRAFTHPFTSVTESSPGVTGGKSPGDSPDDRTGPERSASAMELEMLRKLNEDLMQALEQTSDNSKSIALEMTKEGLRISVFDRAKKPVFEADSVALTKYGRWILSTMAWNLSRYKSFKIEVEGHTEQSAIPRESLDLWELTSGRANTARRLLLQHGVESQQVRRVTGYADTMPMADVDPSDEANRRITIMLKPTQTAQT
jgi:chemotaxis protein MotB